jgi:hypothetical protein
MGMWTGQEDYDPSMLDDLSNGWAWLLCGFAVLFLGIVGGLAS